MLEMSEDTNGFLLPCGFRGYNTRQYGTNKSDLYFIKQYNEPGEVVFSPPFESNVIVMVINKKNLPWSIEHSRY